MASANDQTPSTGEAAANLVDEQGEETTPFASPEQRDMFILTKEKKAALSEEELPSGRFADRELSWMRFNERVLE